LFQQRLWKKNPAKIPEKQHCKNQRAGKTFTKTALGRYNETKKSAFLKYHCKNLRPVNSTANICVLELAL
jgi:hypothetical protein